MVKRISKKSVHQVTIFDPYLGSTFENSTQMKSSPLFSGLFFFILLLGKNHCVSRPRNLRESTCLGLLSSVLIRGEHGLKRKDPFQKKKKI